LIKLYQSYFEQEFLDKTTVYFELKSTKFSEEFTVTEYIVKALEIMSDEGNRSKQYLHERSLNFQILML